MPVALRSKSIAMKDNRVLDIEFIRLHVIYKHEIVELDITKRNIKEYKVLMEFIGA